jgi:hypothetical protein
MGCYTGYLLRDDDGTCRYAETKWGTWQLESGARRDEVIDWVRSDGRLVDKNSQSRFPASTCRGVGIDLRDLVFRAFPCYLEDFHQESLDLRIRTAPHWEGWDAGFAWGGREELGEVVPEARHVIVPYDVPFRPLTELPFDERDDWPWDECTLTSVITPDLRVLDYRLTCPDDDIDTLLPWLVHGASLVDALGEQEPYPLPEEESTAAGVVIDQDRRVLHYWTGTVVPPRLLADVKAAWPGWDVRRLRYGLAEHLAMTGRGDDDLLATPDDVAPEWDTARRALRPDPRF